MCFEIMDEDFRFRYHHPLPNFYKVSNPAGLLPSLPASWTLPVFRVC